MKKHKSFGISAQSVFKRHYMECYQSTPAGLERWFTDRV